MSAKKPTLGAVLKEARESQDLNRYQLARLVAVDRSRITRWEDDDSVPQPASLIALANVLELRTADVFSLAGLPLPEAMTSLPAMLRAEYDLPPEAVADIQRYIAEVAAQHQGQREFKDKKGGNHDHNK